MTTNYIPYEYEVVIVGGGIIGSAFLYVLSKYTNIKRIALVEKYEGLAQVNSHHNNNSQTLHFGDIETNYTLERAKTVKKAAEMVVRYIEDNNKQETFYKFHKMVLAVGDKEVLGLEERFAVFKELFPKLQKIDKEAIAKVEPKIVESRDPNEKLLALYTEDGYAINFQKLSEAFVDDACRNNSSIRIYLGTEIEEIKKEDNVYILKTRNNSVLTAKTAVFAAGPHSLIFAQSLGYGKEYGILPVAGSFYCANNILRGKVYTIQIEKLPFAAIHGDPDINNPKQTRFGPTTKVLPLLERHNYKTIIDFLKTSVFTINGVLSLFKIISDKTFFVFVVRNFLYDVPIFGKWFFLQGVRKIAPSVTYKELKFGKGIGGIRPQVVDTKAKKMNMGESKIIGKNIIFNITPSPGASTSLKNAENDAKTIVKFLGSGFKFNDEQFKKDLATPPY